MADFLSQLVSAGVFVFIAACTATVTYFLTRWNNYKTLSAKYRDRLYELNKMGVQYGDVAYEYMNPANHSGHYFQQLSGVPTGNSTQALAALQLAARVRSYVLFRLNFYEEVYYATQAQHVVMEDGTTWLSYVEGAVKHPMARELLKLEHQRFGPKFVAFAGISTQPGSSH